MNEYGLWLLGLAVIYTTVLIGAGHVAKRKAARGDGFFVGARQFSPLVVALCITGLFSGSTYISILELAYLKGVSAVWYGVAETVQVLIIAFILIGPFRERMLVTISGLIGDRYGRWAKGVGGAITAFAFPMWSVATTIAFASAIHVFTDIPLTLSVAISALLLFIYLQAGGMWSVAFTQSVNAVVFALMFIVGLFAFFIHPGLDGIVQLAKAQPEMFTWDNAGLQVIVAWFGTFLVNVLLAQAAFQMALSCRSVEEGQKGLKMAAVLGIPFIILGVLFGMAAAVVVPEGGMGLIALPQYLMQVLPAPLVGLFFLGIWACALSWGAPCQFSGATSLGRDVGSAINPPATNDQLIRYTKWSLLLLTGLMVVFGTLRTEQSAWWNILAWTVRNSATFAPVLGTLFWPLVTKRSVMISMVGGFAAGMLWYHLGGWSPDYFFLNTHPVWVGMGTNLALMILTTLWERRGEWKLSVPHTRLAWWAVFVMMTLAIVNIFAFESLYTLGLLGLTIFSTLVALFIALIQWTNTSTSIWDKWEQQETAASASK